MEPAITVTGLTKSYKSNTVLKGVDFTVNKGEIFALLGSNGAGKTTAINIMTTLVAADGGSVIVDSYDVATEPGKVRSSLSFTGQFAAVDDILTGRENLELIGHLRHIGNPAGTARGLLDKFHLTEAADRRVSTYSGGMRRRLDIAMGLIGNPPIVFLDEPTTGLDPEARNTMWDTIRNLAKSGTTVFLTTQYLEEADELADTIALLHNGTIVASGTARELKKLVPGEFVELTFHTHVDASAARNALSGTLTVTESTDLTLHVATGGHASQLADLFVTLRDAKIDVSDFAQRVHTLDDVFFTLTGTTEEKS